MDKNTARQLIKETFQNPFNKDSFVYFIKNFLNYIEESKAFHARGYVKEKFKKTTPVIKTYERIGTYTDPEGNKIDILIAYLLKDNSLDRARTTLRNFVADYLKQRDEKDAALVAFVSPNKKDWRFSLIKMEYKLGKTQTGRVRAREELTPARRYSFLVGENESSHTAQSRLVPILEDDVNNPTLKQLEESFNIEKVTKEFFEKYHKLYLKVKEILDELVNKDSAIKNDFNQNSVSTVDFAKKLLGQIVFLYFLQKKGWFGVKRGKKWGTGSKNFLRELFSKEHGSYKNFFNDILEPLFYEALRQDRSYDDDYYSRFNCRIPFLNGGLFDPLNNYDWVNTDIFLPNEFFSNEEKTKEGDIGTGILDIFDRYNFTVKEDEPLEKEVAVDPEMLGKVFENLLEVKDRKSKGTYYTPREIVHYMCQQSLINYLATELGDKVKKEDIETLIKYGESVVEHDSRVVKEGRETKDYSFKLPQSIRKNAKLIDKKLETIRVCDPAVGSGAFLVGMMSEVIRTRNALTPYFKSKKNRTMYDFKRHAIQNCLYGVDIDPGAVEIAKLRLWLSLVVDEKDIKKIKPLPNLDYKITQGNSLIELLSPEFLAKTTDSKRSALIDQFNRKKKEFFDITSPSEKTKKREEIDKLIRKLFERNRELIIDNLKMHIQGIQNQGRLFKDAKLEANDRKRIEEIKDKIKEYQKLQMPGPADHFEWHLNFSEVFQKEKDGFDVVIANPPYVASYGRHAKHFDKKEIEYFIKNYKTFTEAYNRKNISINTVMLFLEQGFNILKEKGALIYITDQALLNVDVYHYSREYLVKNYSVKEIISDLKFPQVIAEMCILLLNNNIPKGNYHFSWKKNDIRNTPQKVSILDITENNYIFSLSLFNQVLKRIEKNSNLLENCAETFTGMQIIPKYFLSNDNNVIKLPKWHKAVFSNNIKRYKIIWPAERQKGKYIIYDTELQSRIRKELQKKIESGEKCRKPETLSIGSKEKECRFFPPKIILSQTVSRVNQKIGLQAALDDKVGYYGNVSIHLIKHRDFNYLKFLLAILNSTLISFYAREKKLILGSESGSKKTPQIRKGSIDKIPIRDMSNNKQKNFIDFVDKILAITKNDDYLENPAKQAKIREYEKQIDKLVYKLYGLTKEEIKIVEAN